MIGLTPDISIISPGAVLQTSHLISDALQIISMGLIRILKFVINFNEVRELPLHMICVISQLVYLRSMRIYS